MRTPRLTTEEVVWRTGAERRNEAADLEKPRMPLADHRIPSGLLRRVSIGPGGRLFRPPAAQAGGQTSSASAVSTSRRSSARRSAASGAGACVRRISRASSSAFCSAPRLPAASQAS